MMAAIMSASSPVDRTAVAEIVRRFWGYDRFRPFQFEGIEAELQGQDSLVVLPTGGGKSLCYAVPPAVSGRTDVVVSPLISLMKDQVDALHACGYPAAALHSGMTDAEQRGVEAGLAAGKYRLLFVAPERLVTPRFIGLARRVGVNTFAIDEAHCISHWGHDFRPEYRQLAVLKSYFPGSAVHAYTATATERVRQDIVAQLGLQQPRILVGQFDRSNLVYRIIPRGRLDSQVLEVIRRHSGEATIVYCISRRDTERLAGMLQGHGVKAAAYHAGLEGPARTRTQNDFAAERIDVVVATVAFGMGIDRSNVRCIVHAGMPKSVEQYQQETGRAGRDGLEAECVLFFSFADVRRWESIIGSSAAESGQAPEVTAAQMELLQDMRRFCDGRQCRHAALARYFGQPYEKKGCGACDACLAPGARLENGADVARQVLSAVRGLRSSFGVNHVVDVLTGAKSSRIQQLRHTELPAFGALKSMPKTAVRDIVYQLVDQGVLERTASEMPVLKLTKAAQAVLQGGTEVTLSVPRTEAAPTAPVEETGWQDVERGLFERLRALRREIAAAAEVPAFVILSDATLRELARLRPKTLAAFGRIRGIGERKAADLGEQFVAAIVAWGGAPSSEAERGRSPAVSRPASRPNAAKEQAYDLFDRGVSLDEVATRTGRARATVAGYLEDYLAERKPPSVAPWVSEETYRRVKAAALEVGGSTLKPVFEALGGDITYDEIRIVMRHAGLR